MENSVIIFNSINEFQTYLKDVNVLPFNINRDIDKRNGVSLRNSILEFGIQSDLVLVETSVFTQGKTPQLYIIEGQHRRIEILSLDPEKIKGVPTVRINYSEDIEEIVNLVSTLNSAGKKWNLDNYAKAWANSGTPNAEDYQKLIDHKKMYNISMNSAILLFAGLERGNTSFKLGNFKFRKDSRVTDILTIYDSAVSLGMERNPGSFRALVQLYAVKTFSAKEYLRKVRLNLHHLKGCKAKDKYYEFLK